MAAETLVNEVRVDTPDLDGHTEIQIIDSDGDRAHFEFTRNSDGSFNLLVRTHGGANVYVTPEDLEVVLTTWKEYTK